MENNIMVSIPTNLMAIFTFKTGKTVENYRNIRKNRYNEDLAHQLFIWDAIHWFTSKPSYLTNYSFKLSELTFATQCFIRSHGVDCRPLPLKKLIGVEGGVYKFKEKYII